MKISYNWLKEFVDFNKTPDELAHDLSLFGHEVESIKKFDNDYILDFEITPNRGDCLSVLGMAREISALYNTELNLNSLNTKFAEEKLKKNITVNISDTKICPRYTARIIENIKIDESPNWIKDRLKSYGVRPLNNIVDITNYIMLETGQPLHAFDYDKILDGKINIRLAKNKEEIITLDNQKRILDDKSIVINDDEKIYDLSGIMGGLDSEIDKNTKTIILQAAIFDPINVRLTSKRLKHQTDASYRYERGVDYNGTLNALNCATELISDLIPNSIIGTITDIKNENTLPSTVKINTEKINQLLGTKLGDDEIKKLLERLNFEVENNKVITPSYRRYDISIWQDIAEEVARIYGYNNLGISEFKKENIQINNEHNKQEQIKDILANCGFNEIYSYSFVDKNVLELLNFDLAKTKYVINPIAPENKYLRPSILPSLLTAFTKNPWVPEINIFEIGKVFDENCEKWQLGIATSNKKANTIKDCLQAIKIDSEVNKIDSKILDVLKIRKSFSYITIDLDKIDIANNNINEQISNNQYQKVSEFPPTIRDLAFIVKNNINVNNVKEEIKKENDHILLVELFDEFSSDKFGKDMKNIAFHIWLQDLKKPMNQEEVEAIIKKIIINIEKKYNAQIRG